MTVVDNDDRSIVHHFPGSEDILGRTSKHPGAACLIVQKGTRGYSPLHVALSEENAGAIIALVEKGVDPLQQDRDGDSALHHLARKLYSTNRI